MALGPQALTQLTAAEHDEIVKLENAIDDAIVRAQSSQVYVGLTKYPSLRVRRVIEKMYLEAGWKTVHFGSDQRDGASVTLQ